MSFIPFATEHETTRNVLSQSSNGIAPIYNRHRHEQTSQPKQHVGSGEEVKVTISQDASGHSSTRRDQDLQILAEPPLELCLLTDDLEETEIHAINAGQSGNHALQDYQMQLLLLQQNKKRLMMARQEAHESSLKKRKLDNRGPTFQAQLGTMHPVTMPMQQTTSLRLIYKIECSSNQHDDAHPCLTFGECPTTSREVNFGPQGAYTRLHLDGADPIYDLDALMEDETDGVDVVVVRTIECSDSTVHILRAGTQLKWVEGIHVKSKAAKTAMQQVATCYFNPVVSARNSDPFRRRGTPELQEKSAANKLEPVELFFFHHRQALHSLFSRSLQSRQHLNPLLDYVNEQYNATFCEADELFAKGLVNHNHVLKLFKPNDLIVSGTQGLPAAFVLQEWPRFASGGFLEMLCWMFETDGTDYVRKQAHLTIPPLGQDPVQINTLPAYPIKFADLELLEHMRARGSFYYSLRLPGPMAYKGWNVEKDQYFHDARFMVDTSTYRKMHPHARAFNFDRPTATHPFDQLPASFSRDQVPSDLLFMLLPPILHGFYLDEKKWVRIFVDQLYQVQWNKKAFERLVLPSKTKELIRALVSIRASRKGTQASSGIFGKRTDITGGKGKGLIMLLHGGPGTGKTLTAESVAEMAEMPLYRVTCGDIGTNAETAERYLTTVLHLGKIWNSVLLLDEADVFLEDRASSDLKRNSLVSVFLRILEYYDGILILTSNRVGMFDEAFKSRIQVALHYENLHRASRKKIWQNFVDMLEEDEEDVNFDEIKFRLDDLAERELNGRQIRNVLTTARQVAMFKEQRLEYHHLEQALTVSSDFNDYLRHMQGHTDEQRARDVHYR